VNARIDQDRPKLRSHAIGFLAVNTLLQGSLRDENGDQWRKFKGVSPVSRRRGARGQRNAKVAGAFRAGATAFLAWWMGFSCPPRLSR
jgi:hypothetical protein